MVDANGNQAQYQYDLLGRLTNEKDAAGGSHTYTYNKLGLLSQETDKNGRDTKYTYDAAGNLIQFADQAGSVAYQYDANGNILSVTGSDGKVLRRTFDALNRVETYTDGKKVHYTYDNAGHMSTVTDWNGRKTSYGYDANGRLTSTTRPDGTKETRSYNAAGQMTSKTDLNPDGSVLTESSYTYDAAGNMIQEQGGEVQNPLNSVTYDVYGPGLSPELEDVMIQSGMAEPTADRNDSVQTDVYSAPAGTINASLTSSDAGNTAESLTVTEDVYGLYGDLQMTYTADNRLATVNGQAVTYDAEGNMLNGPLHGSMQDYRYDARNRLIQAGGVSYGYDNENNRNAITVNGVTTKQIINPHAVLSQVLMETDNAGTPQAWYVYGMGLIGREDAAGNYQTYHFDLRGSTIALTDAQGQVTDTYTYDTYGEQLEHEGASQQPFQYNGRDGVQTDANGLYQMRARYYNPEIKRFVNRDVLTGSIDNGLTMNRYAYVNGNPVSYIDPFGLSADGADWMVIGGDALADMTPVVGSIKAWQQTITGVNYITGEQLSVSDRIGDLVGGFAGLAPVPGSKYAGKYTVKGVIWAGEKAADLFGWSTKAEKSAGKLINACNCFTAGTKVKTDQGDKNIEDIEVGDQVLSKDEATGQEDYKTVTATFNHMAEEIYTIYVGGQEIESTYNHPFWVDDKGWTYVKDLKVGDWLVEDDGTKQQIEKIELEQRQARVYNMTVADFHTYFVSDLGIWVHNTNNGDCDLGGIIEGIGKVDPIFSPNFDKKLKKHAQDIYETSRDLDVPVKKGDKEGMKNFILSIVTDSKNAANSKPFEWNTISSVDAFVKGNAVVLINRNTNEILTFLNKKGDRLSNKLKSELDLIWE
ncbi:polymorphic toxin-type HINT domain-containing protein [Paenibacillus sp. Z6-24]